MHVRPPEPLRLCNALFHCISPEHSPVLLGRIVFTNTSSPSVEVRRLIDTIDSVSGHSDIPVETPRRSYAFSKAQRLLTPSDYARVFKHATIRVSHPSFLILVRLNEQDSARLGLVVAKKHVKRAHQRNLIKRMARETFRLQQHHVPSIDAIVLARRGADAFSSSELTVIFNGLWKRISKQAQQRPS